MASAVKTLKHSFFPKPLVGCLLETELVIVLLKKRDHHCYRAPHMVVVLLQVAVNVVPLLQLLKLQRQAPKPISVEDTLFTSLKQYFL